MSFMYRAFGVPQSIDEFFEAASLKNKSITITVGCYPAPTSYSSTYFIELRAGSVRLTMDDFSVPKFGPESEQKRKDMESDLLKRAKNIQHIATHIGLESKIMAGGGGVIDSGYTPENPVCQAPSLAMA